MSENGKFQPNYAIPPAETFEEVLEDRKMTLEDFAEKSDVSLDVLVEVMEAKREIDPHLASEIERITGVVSSFWLNLERNYRATLKRLGQE